ncbi:hypothetical protein OAK97_00410 [bacterium]|nr:hypothetical protein [bacterium]MDG1892306.1 hypothetical protein [Verrucomicrobiota bacterium]
MANNASRQSGENEEGLEGKHAEHPRPPVKGLASLSDEEQMAQFEEAMKNEDWGHQPC